VSAQVLYCSTPTIARLAHLSAWDNYRMVSVTHAIAPGDTAAPIDLLAAGLTVDERRRVESAAEWIVELYAG